MFLGLQIGSWADWVSGIGSLGAILAVVWQVREQRKEYVEDKAEEKRLRLLSSLPIFNLRRVNESQESGFFLDIATASGSLPVEFVTIKYTWVSEIKVAGVKPSIERKNKEFEKSVGHLYPKEGAYTIENDIYGYSGNYFIDEFYLKCETYSGLNVFFAYGDGFEGVHAYQQENGKWKIYSSSSQKIDANKLQSKIDSF